jgi:hypothetical protein
MTKKAATKITSVTHVDQDLLGNLRVNGKRVGELINGLFRESTDSLAHWSPLARARFSSRMAEHGKEREAKTIIDYVIACQH